MKITRPSNNQCSLDFLKSGTDAPAVVRTFCACVLANVSSPSCFCVKPEPDCGTADLLSAAYFTIHTYFWGDLSRCELSNVAAVMTLPYWNLDLLSISLNLYCWKPSKFTHLCSLRCYTYFLIQKALESQGAQCYILCFMRFCSILCTVDPNTTSRNTERMIMDFMLLLLPFCWWHHSLYVPLT